MVASPSSSSLFNKLITYPTFTEPITASHFESSNQSASPPLNLFDDDEDDDYYDNDEYPHSPNYQGFATTTSVLNNPAVSSLIKTKNSLPETHFYNSPPNSFSGQTSYTQGAVIYPSSATYYNNNPPNYPANSYHYPPYNPTNSMYGL